MLRAGWRALKETGDTGAIGRRGSGETAGRDITGEDRGSRAARTGRRVDFAEIAWNKTRVNVCAVGVALGAVR